MLSLCASRFSVSLSASLCISRALGLPSLCLSVSVSRLIVPSDSALTCLGAQHITCKHTVAHEQLKTDRQRERGREGDTGVSLAPPPGLIGIVLQRGTNHGRYVLP